jgi:hypothetical protein
MSESEAGFNRRHLITGAAGAAVIGALSSSTRAIAQATTLPSGVQVEDLAGQPGIRAKFLNGRTFDLLEDGRVSEVNTQPPATGGKVGTFWIHIGSTSVTDTLLQREAQRRKYVVLNSWESNIASKLKSYNPNIKCFVYKDMSSTRSYDNNSNWQMLPAGVSYQWANANRPDWFLLNSSGNRVQYSGYSGHWAMDIGNVDYQNMWADNVDAMKSYGFDGIWIDNCLWRRSDYGLYPAKYSTDEAYRNAFVSFFKNVTPKLRAAGLVSVGNLSNARLITGGWNLYIDAGLDGGFDEWWISVNNDGNDLLPEYTQGWSRQLAEITDNEAKGKITLVQPHFPSGNVRAFNYTFASYLMGAGTLSAFTEANGTDQYGNPTPWHTEYDWNLGAPQAAKFRPTSNANVWRRDFAGGVAVVNANNKDTNSTTVQLGATYYNAAGTAVTSVTLSGCNGVVLRK